MVVQGNEAADNAAQTAALQYEEGNIKVHLLVPITQYKIPVSKFTAVEQEELQKVGGKEQLGGKWVLPDRHQMLPRVLTR